MFKSTSLDKFELDDEPRRGIKEDAIELLKLGYAWLWRGLFGEKRMGVTRGVLEAKKKALGNGCSP